MTDDSAAINEWAAYLRTNGIKGEWPGGTYFCGTTTLHLGQCTIRGAGAPGNNRWTGSMTEVLSNANPIATDTNGVNDSAFGRLDIENVVFAGAGGTVATIDLWDKAGYAYQVGLRCGWLTMEDVDDDFSQGFGTNRIVNCGFQDLSGWGVYLYKSWGDSLISDCNFRCCGGKAAYDYGVALGDASEGDRFGGDICVASSSVDTEIVRCHSLGSGHTSGSVLNDANYDNRGTFIKLGAIKSETDALGREYLTCNKINLTDCHNEGRAYAMRVFGTKWSSVRGHNSNGGSGGTLGAFQLGWAANPSTDTRMQFNSTRVGSSKEVLIAQGSQISLGEWINATPGTTTPIKYWVPCTGEFNGSGFDTATLTARGFTLEPQADPTTAPGGSAISDNTSWLPRMRTNALPADPASNLLPSFNGGSGTTLTGWTSTGAGTATVDATGAFVTLVSEKTVIYSVTGLTAGDLYTLQVGVQWTGSIGLGNLTISARDGAAATIILRNLGADLQTDGLEYRCVQFRVPTGQTQVDVRLRNGDANSAKFYAPTLHLGAAMPRGRAIPTLWMAADGVFTTS